MTSPWILYQLSDSAFPAGAFAHSAGLEACVQAGEVQGAAGLRRFARDAIWQAAHGALPLVRAAWEAPAEWGAIDARAESFLASTVANRASRTLGRAFVETCARAFRAEIGPLRDEARGAFLLLHHAPAFGRVLRALSVALPDAQALLLSAAARSVLSAGVRLGLAGTTEAQALLGQLAPVLDVALEHGAELGLDSLAQTSPVSELVQGAHDRLYSRLFQS